MWIIKYDYTDAALANIRLDNAVQENNSIIKGMKVFDNRDNTAEVVEFAPFNYDDKTYNISIQDSKGESIMYFDLRNPGAGCVVMTGATV